MEEWRAKNSQDPRRKNYFNSDKQKISKFSNDSTMPKYIIIIGIIKKPLLRIWNSLHVTPYHHIIIFSCYGKSTLSYSIVLGKFGKVPFFFLSLCKMFIYLHWGGMNNMCKFSWFMFLGTLLAHHIEYIFP